MHNGREATAYVQSLRLKGRRGCLTAVSKLSGHLSRIPDSGGSADGGEF